MCCFNPPQDYNDSNNCLIILMICAIRLPHARLSTFHTIFDNYCHGLKKKFQKYMVIVVATWMCKQSYIHCDMVLTEGYLHG